MFKLKTGNQLMITYIFPSYLAISFVILFLFIKNVSLSQLISIFLVMSISGAVTLALIRNINLRTSLMLGYGLSGLALLSLLIEFPYSFYLYPIILGTTSAFFWVPFNYLYFLNCDLKCHASAGAGYFNLSAILGIILPPFGALIIRGLNFSWLFLIGAIIYFLLMIFIWKKIPSESYNLPLLPGIIEFKKLKTLSMLEGSLHYLSGNIIAIFTLFFIQEELQWGAYFSYIAILGVIVSIFLSRKSDKNGNRWNYLLFLLIILSFIIFSLGLVKERWLWIIMTGFFSVINTISYPIRLAFSMDVKKVDFNFWRVREFFLCLGRAMMLGICWILVLFDLKEGVFILFALICLFYLYLIKRKFIS